MLTRVTPRQRHKVLAAILAGVVFPLLTGCGPPEPQAYVVIENGEPVLQPVPCNSSTFTKVTVKDPSTGEYFDDMNSVWEVQATGGLESRRIILFGVNDGYVETVSSRDPLPAGELLVSFDMPGFSVGGGFTGDLRNLPDGKALTSDGIVSMEAVENWSCG